MSDRRAEAHLWLLLEEALVDVRDPRAETWEIWRNFRAVVDALVAIDALVPELGEAFVGELDDAMALRGLVPVTAFGAAPWPEPDLLVAPGRPPGNDAGRIWLEAEIERHLDLFVSFDSETQAWAARDMLRILGGPVRAFEAVGGEPVSGLLGDLAATLAAAGVDPGREVPGEAVARREWVQFLRDRPAPIPDPHVPDERRRPRVRLGGKVTGPVVRVDLLAWSEDAIEMAVGVRTSPDLVGVDDRTPWHARVLDDRGHLHLGQTASLRPGDAALVFQLRPGLVIGVTRIDVRLTRGGWRVEGSIAT